MIRRRPSVVPLLLALTLLVLGSTACVSNGSSVNGSGSLSSEQAARAPGMAGFPSLAEVVRVAAAAADEFLIRQDGADFAGDLPLSHCTAADTAADFSPVWTSSPPHQPADAAYGIYRLTYDPLATPVTLTVAWDTPPAIAADCWIGLSDWVSGNWHWEQLPEGSELELASPERYSDAAQHCFVAVLVLGETACSLATIGYGIPAPPTGDGYTLYTPLSDTMTYLIDMDGALVHTWTSPYKAGATGQLTEAGHLLRLADVNNPTFSGGGSAGRLEEYDWDGNLVWSYDLSTSTQCTHHEFQPLPNGNILLIVWNLYTKAEMTAAGRNPAKMSTAVCWIDSILEVRPTPGNGGDVVWEWRIFDHLIQDFDATKANYGDPAVHPELFDVNLAGSFIPDYTHVNSVAYNAALDQVVVSLPLFNEIWIIDHSTTTAEAASHSGGRYGHGGDLLYRWGNPKNYRAGGASDQQLFGVHNAHWIADGLDGAGDLLIFNNNAGTPQGQQYSTVMELTPPLNPDGSYDKPGTAYGPAAAAWEYKASPPASFHSGTMGSAQRLPGGDTLVCSASQAWFFELNPAGEIVWEYTNTFPQGGSPVVFRAIRYPLDYPGVSGLQ